MSGLDGSVACHSPWPGKWTIPRCGSSRFWIATRAALPSNPSWDSSRSLVLWRFRNLIPTMVITGVPKTRHQPCAAGDAPDASTALIIIIVSPMNTANAEFSTKKSRNTIARPSAAQDAGVSTSRAISMGCRCCCELWLEPYSDSFLLASQNRVEVAERASSITMLGAAPIVPHLCSVSMFELFFERCCS